MWVQRSRSHSVRVWLRGGSATKRRACAPNVACPLFDLPRRTFAVGESHAEEVCLAAHKGASIGPFQLARRGRTATVHAELTHTRRETAAGRHRAA